MPLWGSWQLPVLRASKTLLSCTPVGWVAEIKAAGFRTLWRNGPQHRSGPFCYFLEKAMLVFLLWPIQHCFLWHSASNSNPHIPAKGLELGAVPRPRTLQGNTPELQVMSSWRNRINPASCTENTWKSRTILRSFPEGNTQGWIKSLKFYFWLKPQWPTGRSARVDKPWEVWDATYIIPGLHLLGSASCKGVRQHLR